MKTLLKTNGWLFIVALVSCFVYAEESANDIKFTPDTSMARTRLQADYALKLGEETINFIRNYQTQCRCAVPKTIFTQFVDSLLKKGDDPIVQAINYVPEQSVILTIHNHSFVESTLQNKTLVYHLLEETWMLDLQASTAQITPTVGPPPLPFYYCMGVITEHCQNPIGYQYPGFGADQEFLSDKQWCPEWHKLVRPAQEEALFIPSPKVSDDNFPPSQAPDGSGGVAESQVTYSSRFIIPLVADFPYCVGVLTNHCKKPLGITTLNLGYPAAKIDTLSDSQWCSAWHDYVGMPPQQ